MGPEGWITLGVVALSLTLLIVTRLGTDVVLLSAIAVLWCGDEIVHLLKHSAAGTGDPYPNLHGFFSSSNEVISGFSNEGMLTVGVLFLAVAGLQETGAVDFLLQGLLGRPKSAAGAQARMLTPVGLSSAFLNNTTVVALFLPIINDWCKKHRIAPSKMMIPLSYIAVLGGLCSLIGTSTNLIVNGLYQDLQKAHHLAPTGMGMFDITWIGLPCALGGVGFIILTSRWLLPERQSAVGHGTDPREYTVEMVVEAGSALVGKTIEEAGLRHLPSTYLMEIQRGLQVLQAVSPQERLQANDRLIFVGIVSSLVDLQKIRGLKPATDQIFKLDGPRSDRILIEAVVSNSCPLVGQTIRDGHFRTTYNAVVIAVGRNGERIQEKIGNIVLQPGDALLLEALPAFVDQQRNSRDFYLVSHIEDSNPPRHDRAWFAIGIFVAMIVAVTAGWISMLLGGLLATLFMLAGRCCTEEKLFRSVQWRILIAIAASLSLGKALLYTGAAKGVAEGLLHWGGTSPWMALALVYLVTMITTEMITNNAAAALIFPIGIATAQSLHLNEMPFVMAVMVAASCGFATPIGYQTHMMVMGPGGYRFSDYVKIGLPLDLVVAGIAITLIPMIFPLTTVVP
ncbi:MAG TPA: SLC13 family permease [Planctomycetota bacterium]|nr:SLC13 family permease [Planctomycetota bacterium]